MSRNLRPMIVMSRARLLICLLALAGFVPSTAAAVESAEDGATPLAEHVVLVDWDGFDPDYLGRVATPNLDALAQRGALALARSTFHTISNPARASMSTGAYPEVHGNAAYVFDPFSDQAQGQNRFLAAETIAESLASQGRTVASVSSRAPGCGGRASSTLRRRSRPCSARAHRPMRSALSESFEP